MHGRSRAADRALVLDLDGVLINGMQYHVAAWLEAFDEQGIKVDPRLLYLLEGVSSHGVVRRVLAACGVALTESACEEVVTRKRARYRELFQVTALPGAKTLIDTAVGLRYRLALVTGTTAEAAAQALRELDMQAVFSPVISGDDVLHGKPAPDAYLRALELLGLEPAHCLVLENAPPGIAAAKTAGLPCLGVATYLEPEILSEATLVVDSVSAAVRWLVCEANRSGATGPFTFA